MSEITLKPEWLDLMLMADFAEGDSTCRINLFNIVCALKNFAKFGVLPSEDEMNDWDAATCYAWNSMVDEIVANAEASASKHQALSEAGKRGAKARLSHPKATLKGEEKEKEKAEKEKKQKKENKENQEREEELICVEPIPDSPPVIALPLNDNTEHEITQEEVTELASLYPAVDVMQQLRNMRGWLLSNPSRRKTKKGIRAFITTWLAKEQDRPTARSGTKTTRQMTAEEILAIPTFNPWTEAAQ